LATEVGLAVVGYFVGDGAIVAQFLAILELLRSINDSNFVRAMLHWKREARISRRVNVPDFGAIPELRRIIAQSFVTMARIGIRKTY
jgi:hypothetical protein